MNKTKQPIYKHTIFKHKQNTLLGIAILFIILGLGNTIIGQKNKAQYLLLLKTTQNEYLIKQNSNDQTQYNTLTLPLDIEINNYTSHLKQIKSRLDFYRIVELGGKCFLALAGLMLIIYLLRSRKSPGIRRVT